MRQLQYFGRFVHEFDCAGRGNVFSVLSQTVSNAQLSISAFIERNIRYVLLIRFFIKLTELDLCSRLSGRSILLTRSRYANVRPIFGGLYVTARMARRSQNERRRRQ